jgi:WD40 repeat protein
VAFSPDGTRLVSSGRDGLVLVWDPHAAEPVSSLRGSSYLCCVTFSPDGRRIAAGSWDAKVLLWEASAERDGRD